jgi:TetR/AcrR family transcriptional regulator
VAQAARLGSRAERTRANILAAAEGLFAEKGFSATRLEDVAESVGIRRASIVYYFKDKRELYDAVLEDVFRDLYERIESALSSPSTILVRIEDCVNAWVDFVGHRPSFARILLREVADASPDRPPTLLRHTLPFVSLVEREVYEREEGSGPLKDTGIDPIHVASTIAGATVFFVVAMPALLANRGVDLSSPEQLEKHRSQVLRVVQRLLATRGPTRRRS